MLLGIGCCYRDDPFSYVKVHGKLTYQDGTLIPANRIVLRFVSQESPLNSKTFPRKGQGDVDPKTGNFSLVSSHTHGDGLVRGRHKVLIVGCGKLVPPEYQDLAKTPLVVNTDNLPFDIKVPKPR